MSRKFQGSFENYLTVQRVAETTKKTYLQLDNFRQLKGYGWPGFKKMNFMRQDKGQKNCTAAFVEAIKSGTAAPILFEELMEISRVTVDLAPVRCVSCVER